jgi:putative tricarboxylic transport membrane protein
LVGSYAISNSLVDVWIAFAAGILGFIFRKTNMPLAPFVLAIILGPMFEANLRRTLTITGGSYAIFVTNPISLILLLLSMLSFVSAIFRITRAKQKTAEEAQA